MRWIRFVSCVQIWTVVILSFWIDLVCPSEECDPPGWFGSDCQYMCHCTGNQCNEDGDCKTESQCEEGWFGPACQYVDLASNQQRVNPNPNQRWLFDGNDTSCNNGINQNVNSVTVNLTQPFPLTWLRLHVSDPGQLQNFKAQFKNKSGNDDVPCDDNMVQATVTSKTLDIYCGLRVTADQVVLTGNGVKFLCSVYISGGRNVALRQNTSQSSEDYGGNSSRAVDGDSSGNYWGNNTCTHTNTSDKNPNWSVTFPRPYLVNSYVLYNRNEVKFRLRNFILTSFDEDGMDVFYYQDNKTESHDVYTVTTATVTSPVTRVNIMANFSRRDNFIDDVQYVGVEDPILTLCEVEVYGDCKPGTYGRECEQTCNCAVKNEACFVITGACPSGCAAGYQGKDCKEREESSTAVLVFVFLLIVVMVVSAVIAIIICRRRRHSKQDSLLGARHGKLLVDDRGRGESLNLSESARAEISGPSTTAEEANILNQPEGVATPAASPSHEFYYNVLPGQSSTCISVEDIDEFMTSHKRDFFQRQFMAIPNNTMATTAVGQSSENKSKNRYKNICAYDHSRVHLHSSKEHGQGDYINASFIQGHQTGDRFIASQGPTKTMIKDFVRMLWEQQVDRVVMLTNLVEDGKLKCERYWPDDDGLQLGDIRVELTTTQVFADYTIRRLKLRKEGEPVMTVTQFHFTSWPDKDIPTTPWGLVDFEQRVASYPTFRPIVVHCSAGVGRTGTFIALHNVMREAKDTGRVDFLTTVKKLRQDRMNMVQTAEQYEFLHKAAQVALMCMGTTVTSSDIHSRIATLEETSKGGQSKMDAEFKAICSLCDDSHDDEKEEEESGDEVYQNSRNVSNRLKNRLSNVLPKEYYRVELKREKKDAGTYINAVFLPSFSQQNQQILTQLPLPTTINDFWRLVTQYNVALIVAYQLDLMEIDTSIGQYLPGTEGEAAAFSHISVSTGPVTSGEFWEERQLAITPSRERKAKLLPSALDRQRRVMHLQCTTTDLDPEKVLTLLKQIRSLNPVGEGRTLYMCRDGAAYSGLICVLSLLMDRLNNDQRVTIPLVVGAIKAVRPQVIPSLDQYRLLYQTLKEHIDNSNVYSNFGDSKS